jgi:hypothetical protein
MDHLLSRVYSFPLPGVFFLLRLITAFQPFFRRNKIILWTVPEMTFFEI